MTTDRNDLRHILTALNVGKPRVGGSAKHRKSSLQTWQRCRTRHRLEYVYGLESPSGAAADLGTRAHAWLEGMVGTPGDPECEIPTDLEELRDGLIWAATCAFNATSGAWGDVRAEWSFGKGGDVAALRLESLEYGAHFFAGTVDLLWRDGDGLHVLDYKTGWGLLPAPSESLELALYALAVASHGHPRQRTSEPVHVHYLHLRTRSHTRATLSPADLLRWAEELCVMAWRVETQPHRVATPNRYCASCAAQGVCPALLRGEGDVVEMLEAARAAAKAASARLEVAERAAMAAAGAGDQRLRVEVPTRKAYDAAAVWDAARDAGLDVAELAAKVYPRISATGARELRRAGVSGLDLAAAEVEVSGEKKVVVVE